MELSILEAGGSVSWSTAPVDFPGFETYKAQAYEIAEYIRSIELTEDNVKEVKKELAKVRKATDELNARRIQIKTDVLKNYETFADQVKLLTNIIGDAERALRGKVRELDEAERAEKKKWIRELWNKRFSMSPVSDYFEEDYLFERWLNPGLLNKSTSMKTVEQNMVEYLSYLKKDLSTILGMPNSEEVLTEYIGTIDLASAIDNVNERNKIRETIKATQQEDEEEPSAIFVVYGLKDIQLTELLLQQNNIEYSRKG